MHKRAACKGCARTLAKIHRRHAQRLSKGGSQESAKAGDASKLTSAKAFFHRAFLLATNTRLTRATLLSLLPCAMQMFCETGAWLRNFWHESSSTQEVRSKKKKKTRK